MREQAEGKKVRYKLTDGSIVKVWEDEVGLFCFAAAVTEKCGQNVTDTKTEDQRMRAVYYGTEIDARGKPVKR
jgi:hypothetical protein